MQVTTANAYSAYSWHPTFPDVSALATINTKHLRSGHFIKWLIRQQKVILIFNRLTN